MMNGIRHFGLLLAAFLHVGFAWAQSANEEEYQRFVDEVFYQIWPPCVKAGDEACIFRYADSLIAKAEAQQIGEAVIHFLNWKAHYSDRFNRKDIYYQTLQKAEAFLLQNKETLGKLFHGYWVTTQLRWGKYYYDRGDWPRALAKYEYINNYLLQYPNKTAEDLSSIANAFTSMGVIHREQGAFDLAKTYFLKSIDFEKQRGQNASNSGFIAIAYKHLGDLYFKKEDYRYALDYYRDAIQIYARTDTSQAFYRNGLGTTLVGIALVHKAAGHFTDALNALLAAQKVNGNTKGIDYNLWFHFGELFAAQGNIAKAHMYFNRAFDCRMETFGLKHYKIAEVYSAYGELAARQGDWDCALEHYQSALISLVDDFSNTDIRQNPWAFQRTFLKKDLVSVFACKIEALRHLAAQTGEKRHLQTAWNTVQAAVNAIDILKAGGAQSEEDKLRFFRESAQIFDFGLMIAWELGPEYHEAAFELSEKSKAIVLLEAFRNADALRLAGIPDSLLEREAQLKYEISEAEDALFKGDNAVELRDRLLQTQNDYRALLRIFEQEYTDYYRLRYDNRVITARETRSCLKQDQAMVAYFIGEHHQFAFLLQSGSLTMHRLPSSYALDRLVRDMRGGICNYFLSAQRTAAAYEASAAGYVDNACKLYDLLLAPFAETLPRDLLVIPDGVLGYLPFEALLTSSPKGSATLFKTHPYLLHLHRISYCYSATLWQEMQQNGSPNRQLAAFAPSFPGLSPTQLVTTRNVLDTLYYNQPEVVEIATVLKQQGIYLGKQASKAQFLRLAPPAGILHIASHGIANDSASGYSFIAFTPLSDTPDSNRLYARELYNMRLSAALVVLSACETGVGELKKGEGVISLARAFAYAGAKSVISTLWSVNDESTTAIMRTLYKALRAGGSKSEALQLAKTDYIENQNDDLAAHPFYWSAYIAVGDMRPLYRSRFGIWSAALLVLMLGGLWALLQARHFIGRSAILKRRAYGREF